MAGAEADRSAATDTSAMPLTGMTWSHDRGVRPIVAASRAWASERGRPEPQWTARSLQAFEDQPLLELAQAYDLLVIDHPHVGPAAEARVLMSLDRPDRRADLQALAAATLGPSFPSYEWLGGQWALPIDGAAQVCAYRADDVAAPPSWAEVLDIAGRRPIELPLRSPHALLTLLSLTAGLGGADAEGAQLLDPDAGARALEALAELAGRLPDHCYDDDPIASLEGLALGRSACVPVVFAYSSYAHADYRTHRVSFADLPTIDDRPIGGSVLGGTGIAVSAHSAQCEAAMDLAFWLAAEPAQCQLSVRNVGQPAHRSAWLDPAFDAITGGFASATLATHDRAWVRPRHPGWLDVQERGSALVSDWLRRGRFADPGSVIEDINDLHAAHRPLTDLTRASS